LFFTSGQYKNRLGVSELEARAMPAGEPMVIEVQCVSVEKVVTTVARSTLQQSSRPVHRDDKLS
jgi:hypothetical protein